MCYLAGPEGVARGEDALTILENSQSRSQFIDELTEVKTVRLVSQDVIVLKLRYIKDKRKCN